MVLVDLFDDISSRTQIYHAKYLRSFKFRQFLMISIKKIRLSVVFGSKFGLKIVKKMQKKNFFSERLQHFLLNK